jgi:transcriptional regulator with XRE-family HTH domain
MSIGQFDATGLGHPLPPTLPAAIQRPLHCLAKARKHQGVSRCIMARRLNTDVKQIQQQERETSDIALSVLYAWQKALDIPVSELLIDESDSLTSPVLRRSQLVRLMKTVLAISRQAKQPSIQRMAQTMTEQLIEIMPELAHISPWHVVGKRRRLNELGMAAQRQISSRVFIEPDE